MGKKPDRNEMVEVIGPVYYMPDGRIRQQYPKRFLPRHQAESASVKALGVEMVENIESGLAADPRKTAAQSEADRLREENLELQKRLAEMEQAQARTAKEQKPKEVKEPIANPVANAGK